MLIAVKTIVDVNRKLIGFLLEGKDTEFEGFSTDNIRRPLPLNVLAARKFSNIQIEVTEKGVKQLGDFKIRNLPMTVWVNNQFVDIDNTVEVVKKFVYNDEIIGFRVKFADNTFDNFTYANLIKLCSWFKPGNFNIRKSASGKEFISGKPGFIKLEDLPEEVIENKKKKRSKVNVAVKNDGVAVRKDIVEPLNNELDIIELYTILRKFNGLVLRFPRDSYKRREEPNTQSGIAFRPLGLGEYAYPRIVANDSGINFNADFLKPGTVRFNMESGESKLLPSFVYRKKSLFANGETYLENFGLAIPKEKEEELLHYFGSSLSLTRVEENKLTNTMSYLTGRKDLEYFRVNCKNIDLISEKHYDKYILNNKEIYELVKSAFVPKLIYKYVNNRSGLIADLKRKHSVDYKAIEGKKPIYLYENMTDSEKAEMYHNGIDIYTGAYIHTIKSESSNTKVENNKNKEVLIEYMINGEDIKKWTYSKIRNAGLNGKDLPKSLIDLIQYIETLPTVEDKIRYCLDLSDKVEKDLERIRYKLWLHKCAMYLKFKGKMHQADKDKWEVNTGKRTKATAYDCIEDGCAGLMLLALNTSI